MTKDEWVRRGPFKPTRRASMDGPHDAGCPCPYCVEERMMELHEIAPGLLEALRRLGDEYGPLGVAQAAAGLTDRHLLVKMLSGADLPPPRPINDDPPPLQVPEEEKLILPGSAPLTDTEILSVIRWMMARRVPDDFPKSVFPSRAGEATIALWNEDGDE